MRKVKNARGLSGPGYWRSPQKAQGNVADTQLNLLSRQEIEIAQRAVRALAEKLKARLIPPQRSLTRSAEPEAHAAKTLLGGWRADGAAVQDPQTRAAGRGGAL